MELFRLFGTILVDNSKANKDLEDTDKKGEKVAKTLGEITAEAGAMALGIAAAGAAALTALGIKSVTAADDFTKAMNTLQAQTGSTDEQMKGFEESILFGCGIDTNVMKKASLCSNIQVLDHYIFHLNHGKSGDRDEDESVPPMSNQNSIIRYFTSTSNTDDWGMFNENLPIEII